MSNNRAQLLQKLGNYCNIPRNDGLSYGDYVEQLTFLLFLVMAEEQSRPPFNKTSAIPTGYDWPSLLARDGDELEAHITAMCSKRWAGRLACWGSFFARPGTRSRTGPGCGG